MVWYIYFPSILRWSCPPRHLHVMLCISKHFPIILNSFRWGEPNFSIAPHCWVGRRRKCCANRLNHDRPEFATLKHMAQPLNEPKLSDVIAWGVGKLYRSHNRSTPGCQGFGYWPNNTTNFNKAELKLQGRWNVLRWGLVVFLFKLLKVYLKWSTQRSKGRIKRCVGSLFVSSKPY